MKLVNKNTTNIKVFGEIVPCNEYGCIAVKTDQGVTWYYRSLAELNAEWEDVPEEPKEWWYIDIHGPHKVTNNDEYYQQVKNASKEIGNYFETNEEAELAVRKLKAWKRLKGGGFEFMSCSYGHDKTTDDTGGWIRFRVNHLYDERYGCEVEKDLDLLFSGEDD